MFLNGERAIPTAQAPSVSMEEAVLEVVSSSRNILVLKQHNSYPLWFWIRLQRLFQNLIQLGEVCLLSSGPLVKSKNLQLT